MSELISNCITVNIPHNHWSSATTYSLWDPGDLLRASRIVQDAEKVERQVAITQKREPAYSLPGVRRVHFSGDKCIVLWEDDTKTIVTCGDGEIYDRYTGFIAAVAKKLFGGTTAAKKLLNAKDADRQRRLQEEQLAEEKAKNKAAEEARAKKARDRKVRAMAEGYLLDLEAAELADHLAKERGRAGVQLEEGR